MKVVIESFGDNSFLIHFPRNLYEAREKIKRKASTVKGVEEAEVRVPFLEDTSYSIILKAGKAFNGKEVADAVAERVMEDVFFLTLETIVHEKPNIWARLRNLCTY